LATTLEARITTMATMALGLGAGVVGSVLGGLLNKPSAAMKALNAQMQDFNNYMHAEAKTEGFDATSVFQNLMAPLQRIVQGGPQQAGWSQSQTNAYNAQAVQRGAAMARDLGAAAGTAASAEGGGNSPAIGGTGRSAVLNAQAKAEAATSAAIASGTEASYEQGNKDFFKAAGEERELPGVFATSNSANSEALTSGVDAAKSQQNIDTANKAASPLGMLSKGLSSIGGAASSPLGMQAIKSLATPGMNTPMPSSSGGAPGVTGVTSGGDSGSGGAQWSEE